VVADQGRDGDVDEAFDKVRDEVTMIATKFRWAVALLLFVTPLTLRAAESPVSAELLVPVAETHVIGDHTPLIWRFRNDGSEPLAFMWEGCCRLNGRLTVTAEDRFIAPVPPGQALAHMFAKTERLEPGVPADFETRLSDWVHLRDSGEYQLEGRYTGVLPEQTPQVSRGLKLWRDAAVTPPVRIRLSSVADYLDERVGRAEKRGLRLDLVGPSKLPPLEPSPFALALLNSSAREQRVVWPIDFQLWIVDATGRRLGNVPTSVEGSHQELVLTPGQRIQMAIPFDSGLIEGEPFGDFRVFVDLRQGNADEPRTPSNPVTMNWELGAEEVERLLHLAAGGSRVGLRNAPLKLLRVYLGEIGAALAAVESSKASPGLLALRDQLRLASCLKAYAPVPGRVELLLSVAVDGTTQWAEPEITNCLATGASDVVRLKQVLAVRRHLGWEIGLNVRPDAETRVGIIFTALQPYFSPDVELAGPPRVLFPAGTTNAPIAMGFRAAPIPAGLLLRLRRENGAVVAAFARKTAASLSSPASQAALFKTDEVFGAPYQPIADVATLVQSIEPQVQMLVVAEAGLTWGELIEAVQPFIERGLPFDVCLLDDQ
jgi:hypothetical protein